MHVTAVIPTWDRRSLVIACLGSLRAMEIPAGVRFDCLVVDNGSTDGTATAVREAFPDVSVLALPKNLGFAGGANAGLRRALSRGADWTLLVNNDTEAAPGLLRTLLEAATAYGARTAASGPVGIVAPTVFHADPPHDVWPSAGFRRPLTLAARDSTANPPSTQPYDVDWANGCCWLVASAMWRDVGLFDERFRVYYEDHDLCLRARARGWRILHAPAARIDHRVAQSTGAGSPAQRYLLERSSVPFYHRHTRPWLRPLIAAYRLGSATRRIAACLRRGRWPAAAAIVRGFVDGVRDVIGRSMSRSAASRGARPMDVPPAGGGADA